MNECDIFIAAMEKTTNAEREAFLDEVCGDDAPLRQRIEALLQSHGEAGSLLEQQALGPEATVSPEQGEVTTHRGDGVAPPDEAPHGNMPLDFLTPAEETEALGRLGSYTVLEVVGRGGMGLVLRARDARLNRTVAIKVLAPELAANPTAKKRFLREAQAAAAVVHQHVVTIHAVDEDRLPYLVMEYVEGQSLQEKIDREGHLELKEVLRIGAQVAAGLAAAHAHGMMHRDVKPANILLENGVERVRLTDFGLARAIDDVSVTRPGDVAGTPQYMSPEQAQGLPMDLRSDLFSLGSVLYAMCTGRPPFRADSAVAVLRRVCEDTPRPIREVNPEIPDRLAATIDRLLAKQPADRFQTAAEVANLLNQHLAHVQNPSAIGQDIGLVDDRSKVERARVHVSQRESFAWRRWAVAAAAVLVLVLGGLSVTEATGVTSVAATVIRVVTPQGTLIVETDDPAVKVIIEGDGGLTITGAGPQEVRVRPGRYNVKAAKNEIPLKNEIVEVTRGGKQIVKVTLEQSPVPAAAIGETGAFVLLAAEAERRFDTLAEAVQRASSGDTIEIRGNGPYSSPPIRIQGTALAIRAGAGFRPVIQLDPRWDSSDEHLIWTNASLVLEGLEMERPQIAAVHVRKALWAANCRFRYSPLAIEAEDGAVCVLQNCEVLASIGGGGSGRRAAQFRFTNCLLVDRKTALTPYRVEELDETSVEMHRTTIVCGEPCVWLTAELPLDVPSNQSLAVRPLRLAVEDSVFHGKSVLGIHLKTAAIVEPAEAEATLRQLVEWRGERNLFSHGGRLVSWSGGSTKKQSPGPNSMEEWRQFWQSPETDSAEAIVQFEGGNLLSRLNAATDQLRPEDFRLREDSAGYRALPGGKDLGADIDLVGPGDAYERWKQMPEYQQWLKETGQLRADARDTKSEAGPFVVLGGQPSAERRYASLIQAIQHAGRGDMIEIRGNGPFVTEPVNIGDRALTIRAAEGFRPLIQLSPQAAQAYAPLLETSAPLVLEGLDLERLGQKRWTEGAGQLPAIVAAWGPTLHVANCRFRFDTHAPQQRGIVASSAVCAVRNCQFLSPSSTSFDWRLRSPRTLVMENCLHLGSIALAAHYQAANEDGVDIRLTRNTVIATTAQAIHLAVSPEVDSVRENEALKPLRLEAAENVFNTRFALAFARRQESPAQPEEAEESLLRRLLAWCDRGNVYVVREQLALWALGNNHLPPHGPRNIAEWTQFWGGAKGEAREGIVRCEGGDLMLRLFTAPSDITPADFRLRPDSAGYRAGPDGTDLGADVDLVGPGEAYERWRKTPEYREWLQETARGR